MLNKLLNIFWLALTWLIPYVICSITWGVVMVVAFPSEEYFIINMILVFVVAITIFTYGLIITIPSFLVYGFFGAITVVLPVISVKVKKALLLVLNYFSVFIWLKLFFPKALPQTSYTKYIPEMLNSWMVTIPIAVWIITTTLCIIIAPIKNK